VSARRNYEDILDGLRRGRIFVVAGDLIRELDVAAEADGSTAAIGETLTISQNTDLRVTIRFRAAETKNANGETPTVARVDLIAGHVLGPASERNLDRNETTRVVARFRQTTGIAPPTVAR
jgi:hypothetical protein